jgi:putative membrane protein insertion efficiency factor
VAIGFANNTVSRMTIEHADKRAPRLAYKYLISSAVICFLISVFAGNTSASSQKEKQDKTVASSSIGFYQKYVSDLRYGHCQFEPSCSQYAADAIDAHGWLMGTALAADRLVRCNGGAKSYHQRGGSGQLVDGVDGQSMPVGPPKVPVWLIPQPVRPPLPRTGNSLSPGVTDQRLLEYADFADALVEKGDYERAITEYKRVAFLANSSAVNTWSTLRIGQSYYDEGRWDASASTFISAAENASTKTTRNTACFLAAAAHFNAGLYGESTDCLTRCVSANPVGDEASEETSAGQSTSNASTGVSGAGSECSETVHLYFLEGLNSFASGEWTRSAGQFNELAASCPGWEFRNRAYYLAAKCEDGSDLPMKHPNLAAVMSAVIPGSGQMYSGRVYDGFRHLVFNGLLIYSVYQLFKNDYYAGGYLLAGFTLPFYVGNIVGAKRASKQRNATTRTRFVSQSIAEAGQE